MAVHDNEELDDVDADYEGDLHYDPRNDPRYDLEEDLDEGEYIQVRFSVDEDGRVWGSVVKEALFRKKERRTKIVFIDRCWRGPKPTHGQELEVHIERETKPEDPRRGVLIVQPRFPEPLWGGGRMGRCVTCGTFEVPVLEKWNDVWMKCSACGAQHQRPSE